MNAHEKNYSELKIWAEDCSTDLQIEESARKSEGLIFPTDIELQLRNLKEAFHKIALMCDEHGAKCKTYRPIPAGHSSLQGDFGTPPNAEELAMARNRTELNDWYSANPSFNPNPGE